MSVRIESNLEEVKERLKQTENNILISVGEVLRTAAVLLAPVDEGTLKNSIEYNVNEEEKAVYYGSTLVSEEYPLYIETGTGKMAAQPYIEPALFNNVDQIKRLVEEITRSEMND